MARKQYLTVTDYPQRKEETIYEMRVAHLEVNKKTQKVSARLEDVDSSQQGRVCLMPDMPPPHPGNRTSLLLAACGANANEGGARICLDDLIGTHIGVKFSKSGDPFEFVRLEPRQDPAVDYMEPENEDHISESF